MKLLTSLFNFFFTLFKRNERHPVVPPVDEDHITPRLPIAFSGEPSPTNVGPDALDVSLEKQEPQQDQEEAAISETFWAHQEGSQAPIPDVVYKYWRFDLNEYQPFCPNWGDLDPTVSTISNGRVENDRLTYLCDEFTRRYGKLTTALGYGIIYSIVKNAIEIEERTVSSALKEAIARSNDVFLCVAVVKDYCYRRKIHFDKYEKITDEILQKRAILYGKNFVDYVRTEPAMTSEEKHELIKSNWLFNAKVLEVYPKVGVGKLPLYLKVRIPSLDKSEIVRDFNRKREWRLNQNVVVQMDSPDCFRVLDFSRTK